MQVVKFFILFLILIFSSIIGILYSKRYTYRVEELKQLKSSLNILSTKIKFTYESLPEIFEQISNSMDNNIGKIFLNTRNNLKTLSIKDSWNNSILDIKLYLTKEDKDIIMDLGRVLRKNRCRWAN